MQAKFYTDKEQLYEFLEFIWESESPEVYQSYSDYGKKILKFDGIENLLKYLEDHIETKKINESLCIYYQKTKGYLRTERIRLKPKYCQGHTFRYHIGGWGVINLHLDYKEVEFKGIECWISCNTQKRAEKWFGTYKELKNPKRWDWKEVDSISRKLRRFVKRYQTK
jgi:hypothetical protein